MQKTVRINLLARNSATRHVQKLKDKKTKHEWKMWHGAQKQAMNVQNGYVREERKHRRQDWMLGPLAPNRNIGHEKGVYGTITMEAIQHGDVPESVRGAPKKEGYAATSTKEDLENGFRGETIVGNVVRGDRVVVVAGPERIRGTIGVVNSIDNIKEEVKLTDLNSVDVRVPGYAQPPANENNPNPAKYQSFEAPIPMSHVRLVVTITEDDGTETDCIIRHVHAGPPYVQRALGSNLPSHTRYLTGPPDEQPVELQWPNEELDEPFIHSEGDTTRQDLMSISWVPSIAGSPLGYKANVPSEIPIESDPYSRAPELLQVDITGVDGLRNVERAGLSGFVDHRKLEARQERIAQGIMDEFRTKYKELNTRHDNTEWVKRKMIEDARAIWYQERKVASPTVQAAEAEVQRKARERDERIAREKEREVELASLVREMQSNPARFAPDRKLRKELARMAVAREMQAAKIAQAVAAE